MAPQVSVIDRAVAHFDADTPRKIAVPEWGEGDEPLVIYAKPPNLMQRRALDEKARTSIEAMVYLVIDRACDDAGKPLFTIEDKRTLMTKVDPVVLGRVAAEILAETVEDAAGN